MAGRKATPRHGDGVRTIIEGKKYELRYRLDGGAEKTKVFDGTRTQAVAARQEWVARLKGLDTSGPSVTVAEWCQIYIRDYSAKRHQPKTREHTRDILTSSVINDPLGQIKLIDLHQSHVDAWIDRLVAKGNSHRTIKTKRQKLFGAITYAVKQDKVQTNRVALSELPAITTAPEQKRIFTDDEARRFLDQCEREATRYGPLFAFSLLIGARPGEVLAIHWSDINWSEHKVRIDSAVQRTRSAIVGLGPTKRPQHARTITVPDRAMHALKQQRELWEITAVQHADPQWDDLVFFGPNGPNGKPLRDATALDALAAICKRADVKVLTPYELRHTCASHLLQRGERPKLVAEYMGTSLAMLDKHYSHLMPDSALTTGDMW
jgi:integrase